MFVLVFFVHSQTAYLDGRIVATVFAVRKFLFDFAPSGFVAFVDGNPII